MPKRKRKSYRKKTTIPMAVLAPVAGLGISAGKAMVNEPDKAVDHAMWFFAGYGKDGRVHTDRLMASYGPIAVGAVVHYLANRLGVNRMLSTAKVPLIRI